MKPKMRYKLESKKHLDNISIQTFSYVLDGVPKDADYVIDCRVINNPMHKKGGDEAKRLLVKNSSIAKRLVEESTDAIVQNSYKFIAVGCTWGRHRSVAVAEMLLEALVRRVDDHSR